MAVNPSVRPSVPSSKAGLLRLLSTPKHEKKLKKFISSEDFS
jgi:hypothetical protein